MQTHMQDHFISQDGVLTTPLILAVGGGGGEAPYVTARLGAFPPGIHRRATKGVLGWGLQCVRGGGGGGGGTTD